MGTDFDPMATFFKGIRRTRIEHPFPDPFSLIGPERDVDPILPVINHLKDTTGFIAVSFGMRGTRIIGKWWPTLRKLYLNLCKSEQGGKEQDSRQKTQPSHLSQ